MCLATPSPVRARHVPPSAEPSDEPAQLTECLWLGSKNAASDRQGLERKGITHIVNVADDVGCFHKGQFKYLHCKVADGGGDESIVACFQEVTSFVREACEEGGSVLLHCLMGRNRSVTVALAVLMDLKGWTLETAYAHTVQRRARVSLSPGNRRFVADWEMATRGQCSLPAWLQGSACLFTPEGPRGQAAATSPLQDFDAHSDDRADAQDRCARALDFGL